MPVLYFGRPATEALTNKDRLRIAIEDIEGLIAEVRQAQPMHPAKRGTLLNRLFQVRNNLRLVIRSEK